MSRAQGTRLPVAPATLGSAALMALMGCPRERPLDGQTAGATPDITVPAPGPPGDAAAPGAAQMPEKGPPFATDREGFVGVLVENALHSMSAPSAYCLEDGNLYRGADARVGDLNVFIHRDVTSFVGKTVLVRGSREASLLEAVKKSGPCPEERPEEYAQMRSDWVSPEGGFRTSRARLRDLAYIRATDVVPVDLGAAVDVSGERVIVELENPFDRAMDGLRAVAHYEGGPGKPMPRFEPIALSLPPSASQRLNLAARVEAGPAGQDQGEPRGVYALASVDIEGTLGAVEVRVSIPAHVERLRKH